MRVLAAADIHGALGVFEWLAQAAKQHHVDVVVLAGDLFAADWEEGQREQEKDIAPLLCAIPARIFYIMGNDDSCVLDCENERISYLHERRFEFAGYNFVGYQCTLPFMGGIFEKPENEIEQDLRGIEPLLDERTVLVTHSPQFGVLDVSSFTGEHIGSTSLAALLGRKPVLAHIHGHVHKAFGRQGKHFNVASAAKPRAMQIELPSLRHQVLRGSAAKVDDAES
jgi:Icc-related predicted phosphoesterase